MSNKTWDDFSTSVLVVSGISCSLSVLGGLVIVGSYWRIREIRNYTRKLLVFLTIANMITASGYLLSIIRYASRGDGGYSCPVQNGTTVIVDCSTDDLCRIQSFLTTFSSMASFFWTMVIAGHIYRSVIYRSDHQDKVCVMNVFHIVCWLVPGIITVVAVGKNVLGGDSLHPTTTGPWCWINARSDDEATFWMVISGKGWEVICYLVTAGLYIRLKSYMYRQNGRGFSEINVQLRDEDRNFVYVWLILYLERMWGTIRFFIHLRNIYSSHYMPSLNSNSTVMVVLLYLQAFGDPSQGFSNFILFCLADEKVRQNLFAFICRREVRNCDNARQRDCFNQNQLLVQVRESSSARYGASDNTERERERERDE